MLPAPRTVEWSSLSPAAMEIVQQVGIRLAAGYDHEEIAVCWRRTAPTSTTSQ